MKKKIVISITIIAMILCLCTAKVEATTAGSFSISVGNSKLDLKKNKSTAITITPKNCKGKFTISSSSDVVSISSTTANCFQGSSKITVTAKKVGTATITIKPTDISDSNGNDISADEPGGLSSKTVKITVTENGTSNNSTDNNSNTSTSTSSDATLKNLGIRPNDFTGFRKATTSYNVSVPKSVEKISIYATPTNSKASVTGTGSKTLQIGKNTFTIKVTAEDKKTTKTYVLNITRKSDEEVSTDATLQNLGIKPNDFTGFKKTTTSYSVTVPNDTEKISIYANPTSSKATVTGTGEKELKEGKNSFSIVVTAEDKKTTKTYNLTVTRKEANGTTEEPSENEKPSTTSEGVQNIKVENYELSPSFNQTIYDYTVNVSEEISKLNIQTEVSDNFETEIVGNEELTVGTNIITILARNKKTEEVITYQITANVGNQKIDLTEMNNDMNEAQASLRRKIMIVGGTVILIIILIILFLIGRYKSQEEYSDEEYEENNEQEENQEVEDQGKDTEISEVSNFYKEMELDNSDDLNKEEASEIPKAVREMTEEEAKKSKKYKGKRFK